MNDSMQQWRNKSLSQSSSFIYIVAIAKYLEHQNLNTSCRFSSQRRAAFEITFNIDPLLSNLRANLNGIYKLYMRILSMQLIITTQNNNNNNINKTGNFKMKRVFTNSTLLPLLSAIQWWNIFTVHYMRKRSHATYVNENTREFC